MKKSTTLSRNLAFDWNNQARQYPEHGSGITYFKGYYGNGIWIDCLLYQRAESYLVLNVVARQFHEEYPSAPIFTIHDAIYTYPEYLPDPRENDSGQLL